MYARTSSALAVVMGLFWVGCADTLVDPETVKQKATEVNRAPVAFPDSVTTLQTVPVVINILRNDRDLDGRLDPSSIIVTGETQGQVESNGDSTLTYVAGYEFLGVDTFAYSVADDFGVRSEPAVVKVIVVLSPPPAPALTAPADASSNLDPQISFAWDAVPRAAEYRLEVSVREDFAALAFLSTQPARTAVVPLEREKTYFWRVRAINAAGPGQWSSVRTFSTVPFVPGVPVLLAPADNAVAISVEPTLRWQAQPTSTTYHIQVATNVAYAGAAYDETVNASEVTVPQGRLEIGKRYFWRVRGANAGGTGPWSPSWSFVTEIGIPGAVVLVSPGDGEANVPANPLLRWEPVGQAETYRVQVSRDDTFASPVFDDTGPAAERIVPVGRLVFQTAYWWRVRAANVAGTGPWSPVYVFTTLPAPPAVPVLLSPPDGTAGVSVAPALRWASAPGAGRYEVEVATSSLFEAPVFRDETDKTSVLLPSKWLEHGTMYYWRVRSVNAGGKSEWSLVHVFTTLMEAGVHR